MAVLLIASVVMGELSQTTVGSYAKTITVNEEEVSTISSSAISKKQETKEEIALVEEEVVTVAKEKEVDGEEDRVSAASNTLPSAVDNSTGENGKYFPKINNQKSLGTCGYWRDDYYVGTYSYNKFYDRVTTEENVLSPRWAYARPGGNYDHYNANRVSYQSGAVTAERTPIKYFSDINDANRFEYYVDCEADYMTAKESRIQKTTLFTYNDIKGTSFSNGPDSEKVVKMKEVLAQGDLLGISALISGMGAKEANRVTQIDSKYNKNHVGESIIYANRKYPKKDENGKLMINVLHHRIQVIKQVEPGENLLH